MNEQDIGLMNTDERDVESLFVIRDSVKENIVDSATENETAPEKWKKSPAIITPEVMDMLENIRIRKSSDKKEEEPDYCPLIFVCFVSFVITYTIIYRYI